MKTILTMGFGFILAIALTSGLTAYRTIQKERRTKMCVNCEKDNFLEVPLKEFFDDIARYNGTHVKAVRHGMAMAAAAESASIGAPETEIEAIAGDMMRKIRPSRMCMYTLDTLKKYMCFIETYAEQARIPTKGLGIQFYYAVYPKKKTINGVNVKNLHTLYMVPSYYDPNDAIHYPVDLEATALYITNSAYQKQVQKLWQNWNPDQSDTVLTAIKSNGIKLPLRLMHLYLIDPSREASMMTASAVVTSSTTDGRTIINQGQLCPPACDGINLEDETLTYNQ